MAKAQLALVKNDDASNDTNNDTTSPIALKHGSLVFRWGEKSPRSSRLPDIPSTNVELWVNWYEGTAQHRRFLASMAPRKLQQYLEQELVEIADLSDEEKKNYQITSYWQGQLIRCLPGIRVFKNHSYVENLVLGTRFWIDTDTLLDSLKAYHGLVTEANKTVSEDLAKSVLFPSTPEESKKPDADLAP